MEFLLSRIWMVLYITLLQRNQSRFNTTWVQILFLHLMNAQVLPKTSNIKKKRWSALTGGRREVWKNTKDYVKQNLPFWGRNFPPGKLAQSSGRPPCGVPKKKILLHFLAQLCLASCKVDEMKI